MNIIIIGAAGKMGQNVAKMASLEGHNVVGFIDNQFENNKVSADGAVFSNNIFDVSKKADVIIDFSTAELRTDFIKFAKNDSINYCCFSSNLSEFDKQQLKELSKTNRVLICSNSSASMIVFKRLVEIVLKELPKSQACLTEIHNKNKKDAPSGTALMIKNIFDVNNHKLQIASFRAANVCGEHKLSFFLDDEELTLSHKISDRNVFARGAISLAIDLMKKPIGFYEM